MLDARAVQRPLAGPSQPASPAAPARPPPASWFHRTSVVGKLTAVVLAFGAIIATVVALGVLSLRVSNAVRSYVAGEGFWSRAQKDAVFAIERYAATGDETHLRTYERAIAVPLGDRIARLELEKPDYDYAVAAAGFAQGANHPADIPDMIFLFRYFRRVAYLDEAIAAWRQGDVLLDALRARAGDLQRAVQAGAPADAVARIMADVRRANDDVAVQELRFSATLAAAARWVLRALLWSGGILTLLLLVSGVWLARRVGVHVRDGIAELQRGTARVAAGDFGTPIAVTSNDELGELARAFNDMIGHRRQAAEALEQRLRFQKLVTRLSSHMTTLPPADLDAGVSQALAEVGSFAGADRAYVFWFDEAGERVSCGHEWCAPGIESQKARLQDLPLAAFAWIGPVVRRGDIVHVPRVADVPPEGAAERAEWEAESLRSLVLVPMRTGDAVRGAVCFASVRAEQAWSQETQDLLRIFGEIVVNTQRRVSAERALRERNEALERSNAELEEFAYVASHDLKTPLRGINGFIQLLRRNLAGSLDAESEEFIKLALQSVDQMQSLIGGLLALSRIGRGAVREATDCERVFAEVCAQIAPLVRERNVAITHDALPTLPATPLEIRQLLQNLIGNAIKFQPGDRPRVHVSAARAGDVWTFSVQDWGIGIRPEHRERIFHIFQRLHPADRYEGSGIGLAICRKIVHRHGGRIWVESAEGQGATFRFTLKA